MPEGAPRGRWEESAGSGSGGPASGTASELDGWGINARLGARSAPGLAASSEAIPLRLRNVRPPRPAPRDVGRRRVGGGVPLPTGGGRGIEGDGGDLVDCGPHGGSATEAHPPEDGARWRAPAPRAHNHPVTETRKDLGETVRPSRDAPECVRSAHRKRRTTEAYPLGTSQGERSEDGPRWRAPARRSRSDRFSQVQKKAAAGATSLQPPRRGKEEDSARRRVWDGSRNDARRQGTANSG